MQKKLVIVCLINFLVAALMGLFLRMVYVFPISTEYRNLMHAHSHGAMLGWVYLMLYVLIVQHFVPENKPIFNRLFWLTEIAVIGMMLSFPFQGYAAISITFSSLHIFCSYYFVRLVWKHMKVAYQPVRMLIKAALIFMLFSTVGVWCLAPAAALLGQDSPFFQIAIQFFLHLQFNGWFLFAILALFMRQFPRLNMILFHRFFKLLIAATILTFALPVSWFAFHPALLWINGLGVVLQLWAGIYFIRLLQPHWQEFWRKKPILIKWAYGLALISFIIKVTLQSSSIFPEISSMAYNYHNFVIGFIHLMMLGVISGFLFAFLFESPLIEIKSKSLNFGFYSFIIGFITTELILLLQGFYYYYAWGMLPNYFWILFLCSILLPFGIIFIILNILNYGKTFKTT